MVGNMTFRFKPLAVLAAMIMAAFVAGCVPDDGRYRAPSRGGWEKFRAEAPIAEPWKSRVA